MEGGIFMTKEEQYIYERVCEFRVGKLRRRQCAELIQVTERTVSRMARRIEEKGVFGAVHGNRGKPAWNQLEDKVVNRVMKLVKEKYFDFNMVHCLEMLSERHALKLSYPTFRRLCVKENLVKRKVSRRAKIHKLRARLPNEGLLLQMDGSHHPWTGKYEWCLIGAIDDATSDVPYAEFFHSEGTLECMKVVKEIILRKGVPQALYVDKAEWFGGRKNRETINQLIRACEELGIKVIHAHTPQAKGRIERLWATLQDRLIPELRIEKIKTMSEANRYLQEVFIPKTWAKYKVKAKHPEIKYKKLPKSADLKEIFCTKEYRRINRDHTIRWNRKVYAIQHDFKQALYRKFAEIRVYTDQSFKVYYAGKELKAIPWMLERPKLDPMALNSGFSKVTNSLII